MVSGVCDGFIGNRMLEKYVQQSLFLLDEGATPAQVDGALQRWGLAMGPFAMYDMAGNDIGWEIRKRRAKERPDMVYSKIADRICEKGWFGQKSGRGWYRYEKGNRKPIPDPEVEQMLSDYRKELKRLSAENLRRRDRRALHLRARQRGRAHPRGGHRAARLRHRHGVPHRLRLSALSRRADVLRRPGRTGKGPGFASIDSRKAIKVRSGKPAPLLVKLAKDGKRFNP